MNVLILGHYEIASNFAISLVVNEFCKQHSISIMLSGRGDAFENAQTTAADTSFAALARYEQSLSDELNSGINTLDLECDSFDTLAEKINCPIEILDAPNSQVGLQKISELSPDLVISIRYRKILKEEFLDIPRIGVINLHSGLLPEYRGAMATFWSMLNNEQNIGSTLHFISDGSIDTGEIITRSEQQCDYARSYFDNVLSLYPQGAQNIIECVQALDRAQQISSQSQRSAGNYYSFPSSQNLKEYLAKNLILF